MKVQRRPIAVTDHAVVRWLERCAGVDIEAVRLRIANDVEAAVAAGAHSLFKDGMTYYLDGTSVVTVIPGKRPYTLVRARGVTHEGKR
jgi:hypothetical protein